MNELEHIAILFAKDIKEYIDKGVSLEDLDVNIVYELIDKDSNNE